MHASTFACGPFFHPGGALFSVVILLVFTPRAHYVFIQAFRKCHYNLTGNLSGICPECGTPIETAAVP